MIYTYVYSSIQKAIIGMSQQAIIFQSKQTCILADRKDSISSGSPILFNISVTFVYDPTKIKNMINNHTIQSFIQWEEWGGIPNFSFPSLDLRPNILQHATYHSYKLFRATEVTSEVLNSKQISPRAYPGAWRMINYLPLVNTILYETHTH